MIFLCVLSVIVCFAFRFSVWICVCELFSWFFCLGSQRSCDLSAYLFFFFFLSVHYYLLSSICLLIYYLIGTCIRSREATDQAAMQSRFSGHRTRPAPVEHADQRSRQALRKRPHSPRHRSKASPSSSSNANEHHSAASGLHAGQPHAGHPLRCQPEPG